MQNIVHCLYTYDLRRLLIPDSSTAKTDRVEVACVVEASDADSSDGKSLIDCGHYGPGHIVEVHFDPAGLDFSADAGSMPASAEVGAFGAVLSDADAGSVVDEEDGIGMCIGFSAKMHVVEVRRILVSEKEAETLVSVGFLGRSQINIEHKITDLDVAEERYVQG